MSFLFLREPCGFFRTLIVCLLLTGVVLISKPPFIFQVRLKLMSWGGGPSTRVLLELSSNSVERQKKYRYNFDGKTQA